MYAGHINATSWQVTLSTCLGWWNRQMDERQTDALAALWETSVHVKRSILWCCQRELDGDVTLCCALPTSRPSGPLKCGGAAGICQNLYDSAPSGRYGTMSYLCRSAVQCLSMPTAPDGNLDCVIQWSPISSARIGAATLLARWPLSWKLWNVGEFDSCPGGVMLGKSCQW